MNTMNENKYNIEGGINFYNELYKSLDVEENQHKTNEDLNMCLITNQPLTENHIKLLCGHQFNYLPLYLDIKNHKQKFNNLEGDVNRLNSNEIRCPYCRNKQPELLPYYECLNLAKIHGVNYINPELIKLPKVKIPKSSNIVFGACQFLTLNPNFDLSGNNPEETNLNNCGNCKYFICFQSGTPITGKNNYEDTNYYCFMHKKQVIKQHKKNMKKTEQAASINNISLQTEYCATILKTGVNKGTQCKCKIFKDNLCKRHYNLKI